MAGKSPWRARAALAEGGAAEGGAGGEGAGGADAPMPDADADADAGGADGSDAGGGGGGGGGGGDGSGGGVVDESAAAVAGAAAGGAARAVRLPELTMSVALEECEKALRHCLRLVQWQHRSRLLLARMLATHDPVGARDQLAQLLPSQSSKGRAKGNLPSLYCNLLQYSGAFSDDGANGRPLRACALAED